MAGTLADREQNIKVIQRIAELEEIVQQMRSNQILKATFGDIIIDGTGDGLIDITGNGLITVHGDIVNTNAEIFSELTLEHYFTGSASYITEAGTSFSINGTHFNNQVVYFEANMLVEQAGRTAYIRIYNLTDSSVLANSEITSSFVGHYNSGSGSFDTWEKVRSAAITLPTGNKEYEIQVKQNQAGGGGDNAHFYIGRLVITQL